MELTVKTKTLREAWSLVAPLAQRRSPKPILQNVLLESGNGAPTLTTTDLSTRITLGLRGSEDDGWSVQSPGRVLLPVDRFGAMLSATSGETLKINASGEKVTVRTGSGKHEFNLMPAEEFPSPSCESKHLLSIHGEMLASAIARAIPAADGETSRYAFTSVLLEVKKGELHSVATDGRWASAVSCGKVESDDIELLVPKEDAARLVRLLKEETGQCEVSVSGGAALFRRGRVSVHTPLTSGRLPAWRDVFLRTDSSVSLHPDAFASALSEAKIHTTEESYGIDFDMDGGTLRLSHRSQSGSNGAVELPVDSSEVFSSCFDADFLLAFLRVCVPSHGLQMKWASSQKKKIVLLESGDDHRAVFMPITRE